MTKFSPKPLFTGRFLAAAIGGLLLSAAFAPLEWAAAAWIAPGLILFSAIGVGNGKAFRLGFWAGLVHFLSSLYWLLHMPLTWHDLPLAPALGWLALSAYCALYPAVWVWLCWKFSPAPFSSASGWQRLGWTLAAGVLWTGLEYMRGLFLTGFPWNFVAASQYKMLPIIQIASITGIYGVSFLVVWTSVSLGNAAFSLARKPDGQSLWMNAGLPVLVVAGVVSFGATRLTSRVVPAKELKVAMIQPSIPQTLIWDPAADETRFQGVLDLSRKALAQHPDLLLWPESAAPDLNFDIQQSIAQLVRSNGVWLVFCAGTTEPALDRSSVEYSSALLCDPGGGLQGIYHKRRLVIFGEYVPLVRWFPFLKWLTSVGMGLTPGERVVGFDIKNPAAKMSVLICFEDMFPQEAREHVGPDTDFLINLTNDGWFGHGPEQWQQAASGIFRAVENGVPLVRCTNDGLTCWADAQGRIRQIFRENGSVYGYGFMTAQIPLRAAGDRSQTFYNQHGDWFPAGCAGMGLAWVVAGIRRPRKTVSTSEAKT